MRYSEVFADAKKTVFIKGKKVAPANSLLAMNLQHVPKCKQQLYLVKARGIFYFEKVI